MRRVEQREVGGEGWRRFVGGGGGVVRNTRSEEVKQVRWIK